MDWFQALVLGLVQGLTEFLPISSTAHLRIVPYFLGWDDPGAAFSAVIHLGTLAAVFTYFAGDVGRLGRAALIGLGRRDLGYSPDSRLAWSIAAGTLPIAILGLSFKEFIETEARTPALIGVALIALALVLLASERLGRQNRTVAELGFWEIQLIGVFQALALIPGCSRSGSTISGGLLLGLKRGEAARFSFLLGLPAIAASGLLELVDLLQGGLGGEGLLHLGLGIGVAALSGYLSIGFLLRFLERRRTDLFAFYRIGLGALILLTL
ncbi:MAG: undecaprenyl-diphosphatase UppP [Candidatus Latescibacteria bacterium]|nr:undecaprenyl-diphosphatase UppP [Candidatus Latescibacterota bacterium]